MNSPGRVLTTVGAEKADTPFAARADRHECRVCGFTHAPTELAHYGRCPACGVKLVEIPHIELVDEHFGCPLSKGVFYDDGNMIRRCRFPEVDETRRSDLSRGNSDNVTIPRNHQGLDDCIDASAPDGYPRNPLCGEIRTLLLGNGCLESCPLGQSLAAAFDVAEE